MQKSKKIQEINQTKQFKSESLRYINSYLYEKDQVLKEKILIPKSISKKSVKTICDIGCGNGERMKIWKEYFKLKKAYGIEPSNKGIRILRKKFRNYKNKGIYFKNGYAHNLPFENNSFDIVLVWSVLHWVGRDEYLQSLGEMIRICSKYLVIMDFVAKTDYRVPYHHKKKLFTYKHDFEKIINETKIMKPIERIRYWFNPLDKKFYNLKKEQLIPSNRIINYHSRKIVVFKKDYNLLKIKKKNEFKK